MPTCGTLSANLVLSCTSPIVGGVQDNIYLCNFDDWLNATVTVDGSNSLLIDAITLNSGKYFFKVENYVNKIRPMVETVDVEGRTMYKHTVRFEYASDLGADALQAKGITQGKFVAVVVTNSRQIRVYGQGSGLTNVAGAYQDYYAAQGARTITLASNDLTLEATDAKYFVGSATTYDFETAKTEFLTLVSA